MNPSTELTGATPARRGWLKQLGGLLAGSWLLGRPRPARAGTLSPQGITPFLAEIMMISFNFPPKGWAFCNGQLLPINQNQALFALLGTTYGGNGQTTFALPDLRGRIPVSDGAGFALGQRGGEESHVLTLGELVPHLHSIKSSAAIGDQLVSGTSGTVYNYLADSGGGAPQYNTAPNATLATTGVGGAPVNTSSSTGSNQGHLNMQPFLGINFVIALQGIFPSQT